MPPLPPAAVVLDALHHDLLPAAAGAALVMCLFLIPGRCAAALGSAVAVVVGFAWANYTFSAASWDGTGRLIPWKPDNQQKPWEWLPRAALLLVVVGLASRWLGLVAARYLPERLWWGANMLAWAPRVAAVALVSGWLIAEPASAERVWLRPALAAVMLLSWIALDGVARAEVGSEVAAYQSAMFLAAAALMLFHHWASMMEVALILGCAMFGIAAAATAVTAAAPTPQVLPWEKPPTPWGLSGAIPAGVAFLPALLLSARLSQDSQVPLTSFWLIALAPLVLLPFLIPALASREGAAIRVIRALLVLAPLAAAVVLAAQHEQIVFEEQW